MPARAPCPRVLEVVPYRTVALSAASSAAVRSPSGPVASVVRSRSGRDRPRRGRRATGARRAPSRRRHWPSRGRRPPACSRDPVRARRDARTRAGGRVCGKRATREIDDYNSPWRPVILLLSVACGAPSRLACHVTPASKTKSATNLIQRLRSGGTIFPGVVGYADTVVPAGRQRPAVETQLHPARPARPGQDADAAGAGRTARRVDSPSSPAASCATTR